MSKHRHKKKNTHAQTKAPAPPKPKRSSPRIALWMCAVAVGLAILAAAVHWRWGRNVSQPLIVNATIAAANQSQPDAQVFATYAGSESCRECHAKEYQGWSLSHHGLAERSPKPALDRVAFEPSRSFKHGSQTSEVAAKDGIYTVTAVGLSGGPETHAVVRVIGDDPLRQFLVAAGGSVSGPLSDGRMQTLEASYDPAKNEWFNVYGNEDRQPGEWGHWTGRGMTWNSQCASCHNTRLRKNYDESTDTYHTTMAERSVGCEACHGPMVDHIHWQRSQPTTWPTTSKRAVAKDPTLPHFTRDQIIGTCAGCHSRRVDLTGDFVPGDSYLDHYAPSMVDSTNTYYPDGQVNEEDYEFTAFMGSKMYAAGVRCIDCHEPHTGKTVVTGNMLCMKCHVGGGNYPKAPVINPATHSFHLLTGAGGQCINCHMPQTVYMQRHSRHDHGFTIPDPVLTIKLGIPNACNRCHTDKDAAWAAVAVDKWYGPKMDRPSRSRALTIAVARSDGDAGKAGLIALLNDSTQSSYWKGVAARLLEPWAPSDPVVAQQLLAQLQNADPLVRMSAAKALRPVLPSMPTAKAAIQSLLTDPVRCVRIAAAELLRAELDMTSLAGTDLQRMMAHGADQPAGQLQAGTMILDRHGSVDDAVKHLEKAAAWDPRSAALQRELAVIYGSINRPDIALSHIQEACRLEPNNAEYQYMEGLAYSEVGQKDQTIQALERAIALDPQHARAWYNLGLARFDAGHPSEALQALAQARHADPSDPKAPYAAATIFLRLNRLTEARAAIQQALKAQPGYPPAMELLRSLRNPTGGGNP
jgi:tetratricopeptide (TPR) repeat protein